MLIYAPNAPCVGKAFGIWWWWANYDKVKATLSHNSQCILFFYHHRIPLPWPYNSGCLLLIKAFESFNFSFFPLSSLSPLLSRSLRQLPSWRKPFMIDFQSTWKLKILKNLLSSRWCGRSSAVCSGTFASNISSFTQVFFTVWRVVLALSRW